MATEYIEKQAEYCDKEIVKEAIGMIAKACIAKPRITCGEIQTFFEGIPTADVRSVVTCGKCKYGKYTGVSWFCDKHSGHADKFGEDASYHEYHSKYWFCADGEEKNHA